MPLEWVPREYRRRYLKESCEICNLTNAQSEKRFGRKLQLHHRDKDRKNNTEENLATLCVTCHMNEHWQKKDKSDDFLKRRPGELGDFKESRGNRYAAFDGKATRKRDRW
jgi:hypothetical protein